MGGTERGSEAMQRESARQVFLSKSDDIFAVVKKRCQIDVMDTDRKIRTSITNNTRLTKQALKKRIH